MMNQGSAVVGGVVGFVVVVVVENDNNVSQALRDQRR
jgi:hypothetical protein